MKRRDVVNIIVLLALIAVGTGRLLYQKHTYKETVFLMDTIVSLKIETKSREGQSILNQAFDLMREYESKFSYYQADGFLKNFNESSQPELALDDDLRKIFKLSEQLFGETDSLYDITVGRLSELWDFSAKIVPEPEDLHEALLHVGFDKLIFEEVKLLRPAGFKINLGSLAKGFIIDKAVEFLKSQDVSGGYVNAGGDIRIFGQKKPLKIGIQHPRDSQNQLIDTLLILNKSIVTSGDYERYFLADDVRYHHILDPKTGYPCRNAVSVTLISDSALTADAYSTALFLMHPEKAIKLVESKENMEVIIFKEENGVIRKFESSGIYEFRKKI